MFNTSDGNKCSESKEGVISLIVLGTRERMIEKEIETNYN